MDPSTPLLDIFKTPKAIPELYTKFTENFANQWNEFVSIYDPLENIQLQKQTPTLYEYFSILIITLIAIIREYVRDFDSINSNINSRLKYLLTVIKRETYRRRVSFQLFLESAAHTINPKTMLLKYITFFWNISILLVLKFPILFYYELFSLFECFTVGYCSNSNTIIAFIVNYIPLTYSALKELAYITNVILNTPKTFINQFFYTKFYASPQTMKLCGRKVVSWTDKIDRKVIRNISNHFNLTDTEVLLGAIGVAITDFLQSSKTPIPERIPIIARSINKTYMYANNDDSKPKRRDIGGVVCLNLPLAQVENAFIWGDYLKAIHADLDQARFHQPSIYALTKLQTNHGIFTNTFPSIIVQIFFNYFSRIYTVAVTEMLAEIEDVKYKTTVWGSEIGNIIYWRPTQANISKYSALSLSFP